MISDLSGDPRTGGWSRDAWPAHILIAALIVCVHVCLLLSAMRANSATIDEPGHIASGVATLREGVFAAYRVNPPLPRTIAAIPVAFSGAHLSLTIPEDVPGYRMEWNLARQFAHANAGRYAELVFYARLPGIAWSLLGAFIVYVWAMELFGRMAALTGLGLWCFEPNVLAHASLATADVPATAMAVAACYGFWRFIKSPTWDRAWLSGIVTGLALLTKFTLLLLYGCFAILAIVWLKQKRDRLRSAAQLGLILAIGVLIVNAGYGFDRTFMSVGDLTFVSKLFADGERPGNRFRGTCVESMPMPLPADYVLGIDTQRRDFEAGWRCYLGGEWRTTGRWYFYVYAALLKLPVATLFLCGGAVIAFLFFRCRGALVDELSVVLPGIAIALLVASQSGLQYFRYMLPAMPFAFVWMARIGRCRSPLMRAAVVAGIMSNALACATVHPCYLAFFNRFAGGPENGASYLTDSNMDWGQDFYHLRCKVSGPIGLALFTNLDPLLFGMDYQLPPSLPPDWRSLTRDEQRRIGPQPGIYAVSSYFVQGGAFLAPKGDGTWEHVPPGGFEYFKEFTAVDRAGFTIMIYNITLADANRARARLDLPTIE